mgnify:CR=1 FL=1
MAQRTVVYWRDIPAQIIVKQGRKTAKRQLSDRFQMAIDRAAMTAELGDTDDYLAHWRRGEPESCDDDLDAQADRAADEIENAYSQKRLKAIVDAGGVEQG